MADKNNNNNDNSKDDKNQNNQNSYLGAGIGIGLPLGAGLGVLFNNMAIGAGLGMLLGIVTGGLMDKNTKDVKRDLIKVGVMCTIGVILILLTPKVIGYLF